MHSVTTRDGTTQKCWNADCYQLYVAIVSLDQIRMERLLQLQTSHPIHEVFRLVVGAHVLGNVRFCCDTNCSTFNEFGKPGNEFTYCSGSARL